MEDITYVETFKDISRLTKIKDTDIVSKKTIDHEFYKKFQIFKPFDAKSIYDVIIKYIDDKYLYYKNVNAIIYAYKYLSSYNTITKQNITRFINKYKMYISTKLVFTNDPYVISTMDLIRYIRYLQNYNIVYI